MDYKNGKEWQLCRTTTPRNILGVDCSVKRVVTSVIGCGTPTSSMFLQEEISEPAFVSETQYVDLQSSPFVSLTSMSSLSVLSWCGQEDDDKESKQGAPPSNNNRCELYYHDTVKNIQKRDHKTIEIRDDSELEVELENEKVRSSYRKELKRWG